MSQELKDFKSRRLLLNLNVASAASARNTSSILPVCYSTTTHHIGSKSLTFYQS